MVFYVRKLVCMHTPTKWGSRKKTQICTWTCKTYHILRCSIPLKCGGHYVFDVVHVINRLSSIVLSIKTLHEVLHDKACSINHISTLGCLYFAKKLPFSHKLDLRSIEAFPVAHSEFTKGHILYDFQKENFFILEIIFREHIFSILLRFFCFICWDIWLWFCQILILI